MILKFLSGFLLLGALVTAYSPPISPHCPNIDSQLQSLANGLNNIQSKLREMDNKIERTCGPSRSGNIIAPTFGYPTTTQSSNWPTQRPGNPIRRLKLRFKVQGKNFPDMDALPGDTTDPYVEVYVSTDMGQSKSKIGTSNKVQNNENPVWGTVFEFDFERGSNQWLLFHVKDSDALIDRTVGRSWVNVEDFVDRGQRTYAMLSKDKDTKGYIQIASQETVDHPTPGVPSGFLPLPSAYPTSAVLKFKVSANGVGTSTSDPYVIVKLLSGVNGKEISVLPGRTATLSNTGNPAWGEVFSVPWEKKKGSASLWLRFDIYDNDNIRKDDPLGVTWIELNDYIAKGETYTLPMPEKGTLTITKRH